MYRTVVVEDEERILHNICRRIERVSSRFRVVASFTSSLQALQYLQNNQVDAVLTDIRMPGMDGLTLIEKIGSFQNPLIVIVSSYQDFSYAKNAIRLNVCDYLLKPFLDEELGQILGRLVDRLDSCTTEILLDELPRFLKSGASSETLTRLCANMNCFSLVAGCCGTKTTFYGRSHQDTVAQKVKPVCNERNIVVPFFVNDTNLMVCFCAGCGDTNTNMAQQQAKAWQTEKNTAVYTSCVSSLAELPALYTQLCESFTKAVFLNKANVVNLAHLDVPIRDSTGLLESYRRLTIMIQTTGQKTICEQLDVIVQQFEALSLSQYDLQQQISILIFQYYAALQKPQLDYYSIGQLLEDVLGNCTAYSDITGGLMSALTHFATDNEQNRKGTKQNLAQAIKNYLEKNVLQPVGLTDIAEHFGYSHTYIIRIFREVFGTSPIEYLIQMKIQMAKELLRVCPEKSIRAIGEQMGYSSQYYFSRAFKQVVGVSPVEYRRSL